MSRSAQREGGPVGLRDLDLNLLVVFNQLMQESRVNAVARSLGITQPAVSNALRRLRHINGWRREFRTLAEALETSRD